MRILGNSVCFIYTYHIIMKILLNLNFRIFEIWKFCFSKPFKLNQGTLQVYTLSLLYFSPYGVNFALLLTSRLKIVICQIASISSYDSKSCLKYLYVMLSSIFSHMSIFFYLPFFMFFFFSQKILVFLVLLVNSIPKKW